MAINNQKAPTNGYGFLEKFLARRRTSKVDKIIPFKLRSGAILDIGCGSFPFFLSQIKFAEKVGLDKTVSEEKVDGIKLRNYEFIVGNELPVEKNYFSVVTLLAFLEHLDAESAKSVLNQSYKTLIAGGVLIATTPWSKTKGLLTLLSAVKIVSPEEISEHKQFYSRQDLLDQLIAAGFSPENVTVGSFELGLNLYIVAKK